MPHPTLRPSRIVFLWYSTVLPLSLLCVGRGCNNQIDALGRKLLRYIETISANNLILKFDTLAELRLEFFRLKESLQSEGEPLI